MVRTPIVKKASFVIVILWAVLSFVVLADAIPRDSVVTNLPGFNATFPSKHYSGYVTIGERGTKKLFYYLVESERNPAKDPLVLWLNGGPGCSSFDGFVYEHGPFNFEAAKSGKDLPKLHVNQYSWSKVSNIIYLDSPAGVGYSYSTNASDYLTGDAQIASDTHHFLLKWFDIFKELQSNPFYISGESYAGIYVPTLAYEVSLITKLGFSIFLIRSKIVELAKTCKGKYYNVTGPACQNLLSKVDDKVLGLNVYNILEPCYHDPNGMSLTKTVDIQSVPDSFKKLGKTERPLPVRKRMFGRAWPHRAPVRDGLVPTWQELSALEGVPCVDDSVATSWLNNKQVRKALHAAEEEVAGMWTLCTGRIRCSHDTGSMIKYHRNLTSRGYAALVYSGDHDMCVPYTGSEAWTRSLGYKVIDEWRPWMSNDQVAGFVQGYEKNLTFMTILGSGHTVPEYKPREALDFYSRWLAGKPI
ncbi:hypothetical protein V2J09_018403 [Rumex salicifolius]